MLLAHTVTRFYQERLRKHKRLYYDPSIDRWQKKVCGGRATDIDDGWFDAVDFDAESDVNSQSGSDDRSLASIDAFVTTASDNGMYNYVHGDVCNITICS